MINVDVDEENDELYNVACYCPGNRVWLGWPGLAGCLLTGVEGCGQQTVTGLPPCHIYIHQVMNRK